MKKETHVAVPITLLEQLIDGGLNTYSCALGGDSRREKGINNAAIAASHILRREEKGINTIKVLHPPCDTMPQPKGA